MQLREYQQESKDQVRSLFTRGVRRVILCKPTGAGKTVTFASIAQDAVKKGNVVGIVVDRKELLDQAAKKLIAYGLAPQIIRGSNRVNYRAKAFVATVQTLVKRPQPGLDLLIIDEAHKQTFDKLLLRPEYEKTFIIGATATPIRTGRMSQLSNFYSAIVEPVTLSELIADGYLMPAITYAAKDGADLAGVKTSRGDYDNKQMFEAFNRSKLYAGVVEQYLRFARDERAICFCVNVEHSKKTAQAFESNGISAVHVDGAMSEKDREAALHGWRNGLFKILCNCELFTTGFDEPSIETVIVNRATQSIPLWLQMCGRGSRPCPEEGKASFNIIDMGANVYRLGFWEQDREFKLTHEVRKKKGEAPVKECDPTIEGNNGQYGCGAIVPASATVCKHCGREFPIKEKKLLVSDFGQVDDKRQPLPPELKEKKYKEMTLEELETVRKIRGYNIGWLIRQVAQREDLTLEELQKFKGYKAGWVHTTKKRLGLV
jgi:superfamily II DNA or RNA helicase